MTFDELALDLINKTNGFTELNGAYKVVSKADVQNAETILKTYYQNVDKKKLDYTNNDAEGIDYVIRFDTPLYNFDLEESIKMNEDYVIKPTYRTKGVTREDVEKYAELLGLDYEAALRRWKRIQAPESNYERVLDRLEPVDEAIEKHDTLNPKLWDSNNELKPEVRKKIEEIVQKFDDNLKENDVELNVKDICIIGSNANYNYSPDSDVDIHVIADTSVYPNQEDLAMKVYLAYKSLFNNKYDPMLNGIEAEIYVEPDVVKANSNGIYSLNQGWLKEPEQVDVPDIDPEHVQELVKPFEDRYNEVKVNPTIEDVDELIDDIYLQRQKSIMNDGEFGDGNICFKEFRNRGYLQDLRDLKVELENEEMSLNTFGEGVTRVFDLNDNELDLNEDIDLKAGQIFENGPEHTIEIISIDDDLVNYKEKDGNNEYEDTEYLPRLNAMLSEYGFKLAESLNEVKDVVPLDEDVWSNDNGTEFSFPNVRDTLAVYLEWEGIIGEAFLDDIMDFAEAGYDALSDYLDEEGIYGYTERIYNIFNGEPAWCSQMDEDDFVSVCRALYIDPNDAINYDDLTEDKDDVKVIFNPLEEGDYLGSKRDLTRDEKKMYLRSIPKFRVIPHPGNHIHKKPFTVQSGRHYQTVDDVYKDYPKDEYDVELVEDIVKLKNGKWANKGKEGTHGKFKTKKAADDQRKAMFANGYHESLDEEYRVPDSEYEDYKNWLIRVDKRINKDNVDEYAAAGEFKYTWRDMQKRKEAKVNKYLDESLNEDKFETGEVDQHALNGEVFNALAEIAYENEVNGGSNTPEAFRVAVEDFIKKFFAGGGRYNEYDESLNEGFKKGQKFICKASGPDPELIGTITRIGSVYKSIDGKSGPKTIGVDFTTKDGEHYGGLDLTRAQLDDYISKGEFTPIDESLNEGTFFDSMPGYMTPEEVRAFNREKEAQAKAEKDAARAEKKAAAKEKAKAERERQKRIDQREKVNNLSYDSLADMAGLDEDNNDLTKDELLAILRSNMSDAEILKMHKKMFEDYEVGISGGPYENDLTDEEEYELFLSNGGKSWIDEKPPFGEESNDLNEADEVDIKAKALASNLGIDVSDVEQVDDCTYEADGGEYRVCTEEEAYKYAVEYIKGVFEDIGIQAFTPNFQKWILNNAIDMDAVNGIIDDEIDYFENSEDDPEMLEYLRGLNNDDDKVQFIKDLYGDSFSIWAKDYIDIDKVAEEAIKEDGVAHFVAYYDDDEVDLGNGLYAYRID